MIQPAPVRTAVAVTATAALAALLLAACGDAPVSYSAPVGINLKAKSGDVKSGTINDEKGITTESGNPYGVFINEAEDRLGGGEPSRVVVDFLTLTLGGASKNVTALEQVFSGVVTVLFVMDDTKNSFKVGEVTSPTATGPVPLTASFDGTGMNATDRAKLVAGSFKVVLRGTAASGFVSRSAEADLQLTFAFQAFE